MNQEQEKHLAEGIKILIRNLDGKTMDECMKMGSWLSKYEDVFNPPKFGEDTKDLKSEH